MIAMANLLERRGRSGIVPRNFSAENSGGFFQRILPSEESDLSLKAYIPAGDLSKETAWGMVYLWKIHI
jgi:hypothetical protein